MRATDTENGDAMVTDEELRMLLSESMASGSPGSRITRLSRTPFSGATSFSAESIELVMEGGLKTRFFLKDMSTTRLPKEDLSNRRRRELFVYRNLLSQIGSGTPRYYGAIEDEPAGQVCLLLEFVEGTTLGSLDFRHWVLAAEWIGRFQGMCARLGPEFGQHAMLVDHDHRFFQLTAERAQRAVNRVSPSLGTTLARALRRYDQRVAAMVAYPRAMVHGSFRPRNILVEHGAAPPRICPVDWELAGWGAKLYDLAFLANGCGTPDLDTYWHAYSKGAAAHGMAVPALDDARWILDSLYLHKVLRSLSRCVEWDYPRSTVVTLVHLVLERAE